MIKIFVVMSEHEPIIAFLSPKFAAEYVGTGELEIMEVEVRDGYIEAVDESKLCLIDKSIKK